MDFAEHRIETADGLKVYVRDYAAEGSARGLPVICLHGLTRNSADFEAVAPEIAAQGRRVVAMMRADAASRATIPMPHDTAQMSMWAMCGA